MKYFLLAALTATAASSAFGGSIISFDDREDGGTAISASSATISYAGKPCCDSPLGYTVSTAGPVRSGYLVVSYGGESAYGLISFNVGNFRCSSDSAGPIADHVDCNSDPRALLVPFTLGQQFQVSIFTTAYSYFAGSFGNGWFSAELFENADDDRSGAQAGNAVHVVAGATVHSLQSQDADFSRAPEPGTFAMGLGMIGIAGIMRRIRRG